MSWQIQALFFIGVIFFGFFWSWWNNFRRGMRKKASSETSVDWIEITDSKPLKAIVDKLPTVFETVNSTDRKIDSLIVKVDAIERSMKDDREASRQRRQDQLLNALEAAQNNRDRDRNL